MIISEEENKELLRVLNKTPLVNMIEIIEKNMQISDPDLQIDIDYIDYFYRIMLCGKHGELTCTKYMSLYATKLICMTMLKFNDDDSLSNTSVQLLQLVETTSIMKKEEMFQNIRIEDLFITLWNSLYTTLTKGGMLHE